MSVDPECEDIFGELADDCRFLHVRIIWEAHMRTEEDIMIEISNSKKFKFVKFMVIIGEGH